MTKIKDEKQLDKMINDLEGKKKIYEGLVADKKLDLEYWLIKVEECDFMIKTLKEAEKCVAINGN